MFVMLQEADTRTWSTLDLTSSFGWGGNQGSEQQDIHELNRVLFDAIEQALQGTVYDSLIHQLYFGMQCNVIKCLQCDGTRKRQEDFFDLYLDVKGLKGVNESLERLFGSEMFDGDNKLECEVCQEKTPSLRGLRLSKLPPMLTVNLNRLEMDYETFTRRKVNDRFEYPLELDLSRFLEDSLKEQLQAGAGEEAALCTQYELKSIVIHRGGAMGGHYHAYIRDDLVQGNWDVQLPSEFEEEPREVIPVS